MGQAARLVFMPWGGGEKSTGEDEGSVRVRGREGGGDIRAEHQNGPQGTRYHRLSV